MTKIIGESEASLKKCPPCPIVELHRLNARSGALEAVQAMLGKDRKAVRIMETRLLQPKE